MRSLPCADCARAIIQSGITEIVVPDRLFEGKGDWKETCGVGLEMMKEAGVEVIYVNSQYERITCHGIRCVSLKP